MLGWFVDKNIADMAMVNKVKIDEKDVEIFLDNVSDAIFDERVQINKIFPYFTEDALFNIKTIINQKKSVGYRCTVCVKKLEIDDTSIGCDVCLQWSHFKGQNINESPSNKYWCCKKCRKCLKNKQIIQ